MVQNQGVGMISGLKGKRGVSEANEKFKYKWMFDGRALG